MGAGREQHLARDLVDLNKPQIAPHMFMQIILNIKLRASEMTWQTKVIAAEPEELA